MCYLSWYNNHNGNETAFLYVLGMVEYNKNRLQSKGEEYEQPRLLRIFRS